MVLPSSGQYISFSNLQVEFGGSDPIMLSEYYSSGAYTTGVVGIPSSGAISISNFSGKSKPVAGGTNLVQNPNFTTTNNWTSATGWGSTENYNQTQASSQPSIKLNDPMSTYPTYLMFSFSGGQLVSQSISLSSPKSSYTFSYYVSTDYNRSIADSYTAKAIFKNGATVIQTIGITTSKNITSTVWTQETFTSTTDLSSATTVTIEFSGRDNGNWNGNYGPRFTQVSLV